MTARQISSSTGHHRHPVTNVHSEAASTAIKYIKHDRVGRDDGDQLIIDLNDHLDPQVNEHGAEVGARP